jgi:circadian clock protein KaiC
MVKRARTRQISPATASTGIKELDVILGGGFLRGELHLLEGGPGTGKTTLALQFLLEGARASERCIYLTLAQSRRGLEEIAASHGWPLDGIELHELSPAGVHETVAAQQSVLHTADVELAAVTREIVELVQRVKPRRVVLDSMGTIRLLAGSRERYHREILSLKELLTASRCTALFLAESHLTRDAGSDTGDLQTLCASITELDQETPDYGTVRRRLRVVKTRALEHEGGIHNFNIYRGRVEIYPRLAAFQRKDHGVGNMLESGVRGLDEVLGGGVEEGTACVLVGPPGSGKSTLAGCFVHEAAKRRTRSAIYLFDERAVTFLSRSKAVGVNLDPGVRAGRIVLHQLDTTSISAGEFAHRVREEVEKNDTRVVVIDSLTGYFSAIPNDAMLSAQMHELLMFLGRSGVVTLLIVVQPGFMTVGEAHAVDVSYLSDTILVLRQFEASGHVRRCIGAMKKRGGEHSTTLRELLIQPGSVQLGEVLSQYENILSGSGTLSGTSK